MSPLSWSDNWLEKKNNADGAEGLWRIHNKLYDFTVWSRIHPGGKFWLDITRGTDITEAFESHHFSEKSESQLEKFYQREAAIPRISSSTFHANGFYRTFKRRVRDSGITLRNEPSTQTSLLSDALAVSVFVTAVLGSFWPLISGIFLGMLSISSHSFLHGKSNPRANYLHLSLMSTREWKIKHVLSHHQYRGTNFDLQNSTSVPFEGTITRWLLQLMAFAVSAHIQFFRRLFEVFLSRKLRFDSEELIGFCLPSFLYVFTDRSPWDVFVVWNLIILTGSFIFCVFSSSWTQDPPIATENCASDGKDYGIAQIILTSADDSASPVISFFSSYRKNPLHYLCPAVDVAQLKRLLPVYEASCRNFGIIHQKNKSTFKGLSSVNPTGHVFFS